MTTGILKRAAVATLSVAAWGAGVPQEAQACVGNSCGGAATQAGNAVAQASGGSATVNTPKLGLGVMLGGGSPSTVPDNCVKSYYFLIGGETNGDRNSKPAQECRDRQGQLQIGLMAAQSDDAATKASGMALLGSLYPAYGDINKKLVEKMTVCFNGGKDYVPAVPATPAPTASAPSAASAPAAPASAATAGKPAIYGKPRELADHWLKINSDNPAIHCGPTIESVDKNAADALTAQRAHEVNVARAGKSDQRIEVTTPPAPPASCPAPAPAPRPQSVRRAAPKPAPTCR